MKDIKKFLTKHFIIGNFFIITLLAISTNKLATCIGYLLGFFLYKTTLILQKRYNLGFYQELLLLIFFNGICIFLLLVNGDVL